MMTMSALSQQIQRQRQSYCGTKLLASLSVALAVAILSGCGSAPMLPAGASDNARPTAAASSKTVQAGTVQLPKAGSGHGGYYKDDGPGDNPPEGLENTVDPVPQVEAYSKSGNKPYAVFGKTYTPLTDTTTPFVQRGTASWYGKKFHGQKTSSGELYDMYKITAAHPTLPIPSYARVTNLANGKQIIVRINDRGPFHSSRIMDLSYTAALKLGYIGSGSSQIEVERLLPEDIEKMAENRKNQLPSSAVNAVATLPIMNTAPVSAGKQMAVAADNPPPAATKTNADAPDQISMEDLLAMQNNKTADAKPVEKLTATQDDAASGFYIQFGAFALRANAENVLGRLKSQLDESRLPAFDIVQQGSLYRLVSGPFASRSEASSVMAQVASKGVTKPLIVQRQ